MITFVGDIFTSEIDVPSVDFQGTVVYNQEFVIGDVNVLHPAENTVNLINNTSIAKRMFGKAEKLYANLSNNHIFDYGLDGLESTKCTLQKENIGIFGDVLENQTKTVCQIDGRNVVFLGYYMNAFTSEDEIKGMTNILEKDLAEGKENNNIVFVIFHFGNEHYPRASEEQMKIAHKVIDLGAEMVIGHHSHCIQNIEKYKGKYIFYSLGDFYFPNFVSKAFWNNGMSKSDFMWRNLSWTKKGLAVSYNLSTNDVEVYKTCFTKKKIKYKKINMNRLKANRINQNMNKLIGEMRKLVLFILWNLCINGQLIYWEGILCKFQSVKQNGRFKKVDGVKNDKK